MEKRYLDETEAAAYLNREASTLRAWRTRGTGPAYIKDPAGGVHYTMESLDAWINSGQTIEK